MNPERSEKQEIQAQRTIFSIRIPSEENDIENLNNILLPWIKSQDNPSWLIHNFEVSEDKYLNFTIDSASPLEIAVFDNLKEYLDTEGYTLFSTLRIPASPIYKNPSLS